MGKYDTTINCSIVFCNKKFKVESDCANWYVRCLGCKTWYICTGGHLRCYTFRGNFKEAIIKGDDDDNPKIES
jgi:hypothetical protein